MEEEDSLSGFDPSLEGSFNTVPPAKKPVLEKKPLKVLVATTQRIEGKRIGKYFGLVHANVVIDLNGITPSASGAEYQEQFKKGTRKALSELKNVAAMLEADAIVATSLNFHRIGSQSILLAAVGTAVQLEGPKTK